MHGKQTRSGSRERARVEPFSPIQSVTESGFAMRAEIRQILLTDWDPSNAARFDAASHEYDGYIEPLCEMIQRGASEQEIVDYLHERELESMCFPSLGTQRLVPVA